MKYHRSDVEFRNGNSTSVAHSIESTESTPPIGWTTTQPINHQFNPNLRTRLFVPEHVPEHAMAEHDDPVIHELPVYFTSTLGKQTYLTQYPLRPSYRPLSTPVKARFKPQNEQLELDIALDQTSGHFDQSAEDYLQQSHRTFESTKIEKLSHYCVGVYRDGELHLTPIQGILQLRPSLSYIDKAADDIEQDDMVTEEDESTGALKQEEDSSTSAVQLQLRPKNKHAKQNHASTHNSYALKRQQMNAESWIELKVQTNAVERANEFDKLICASVDTPMLTHGKTNQEYLASLQYTDQMKARMDMDQRNKEKDPTLQYQEKLIRFMQTEFVVTFDQLCQIDSNKSPDEVLDVIQDLVLVIHGCFVLFTQKSPIIEAILYLLHQFPSGLNRLEAEHYLGSDIPVKTIKNTLQDCAILQKESRLWTLKQPSDETFIQSYPSFIADQFFKWKTKAKEMENKYPSLKQLKK